MRPSSSKNSSPYKHKAMPYIKEALSPPHYSLADQPMQDFIPRGDLFKVISKDDYIYDFNEDPPKNIFKTEKDPLPFMVYKQASHDHSRLLPLIEADDVIPRMSAIFKTVKEVPKVKALNEMEHAEKG